jgi:hypothetical protein
MRTCLICLTKEQEGSFPSRKVMHPRTDARAAAGRPHAYANATPLLFNFALPCIHAARTAARQPPAPARREESTFGDGNSIIDGGIEIDIDELPGGTVAVVHVSCCGGIEID